MYTTQEQLSSFPSHSPAVATQNAKSSVDGKQTSWIATGVGSSCSLWSSSFWDDKTVPATMPAIVRMPTTRGPKQTIFLLCTFAVREGCDRPELVTLFYTLSFAPSLFADVAHKASMTSSYGRILIEEGTVEEPFNPLEC